MATQVASNKSIVQGRTASRIKFNKTQVNVFLDLFLTAVFVVEMEEHFTGLALHELLGLLFAVAFGLHIVLHWDWIVSITRTFFKKLLHESRLNYVLNGLLLADMLFVTVSGILISRTLGLNLSLGQDAEQTWKMLHMIGADLVLVIVALHLAMHWKWIKTHGAKYLLGWLPKRSGGRRASE